MHWLDTNHSHAPAGANASEIARYYTWDTATYQDMFTASLSRAERKELASGRATLFEATPSYIAAYETAPRAKHLVPHAKFVLVLRVRSCSGPRSLALAAACTVCARACDAVRSDTVVCCGVRDGAARQAAGAAR